MEPAKKEDSRELLGIKELAKRWQMSTNTLAIWRMRGEGPPYIKIGRKIFYKLTAVEELERQHTKSSTKD